MACESIYDARLPINGRSIALYKLAKWKNGMAFKKADFSSTGLPIIKIAELNGGISDSTAWTEGDYGKDVFLTKGDYVFSWSGNPETSIDIFRYNLQDGWLNQHIFKVTPETSLVREEYFFFLMKWLKPVFKKIAANKQTTGLGHVTLADLKRIQVTIPSFEVQERIERILCPLDFKIRLNNQLNDYLANLLDAAFANSAKSGSKEFGLPEVVDILSGGTPKTKNAEYWEDGRIPFFTPGDVTNSVYTLTTEKHITDVGLDNCNSELYPVDTVFLTARGTVGKVAIAGRPMAMNQSCFAFRGKSIPQSVVFQIIKNAVKTLRAKANGATFAAINTRDLKIETVAVPCNKEIAHYDESASKWLDLIRTNEEENLQLSALRDILLPKLMSGEIDVSKVDLTQLTNNHLADC